MCELAFDDMHLFARVAELGTRVGDARVAQRHFMPGLAESVDRQALPVNAVTAVGRHRLPKIKACIEHRADRFGNRRDAA